MKTSAVLNSPHIMKQVKILAFYPDEDREVWTKHQNEIPDGWINSYDKELTVLTEECYDLKAMPALYLLDKDKKVLLKDATVKEIEDYLKINALIHCDMRYCLSFALNENFIYQKSKNYVFRCS